MPHLDDVRIARAWKHANSEDIHYILATSVRDRHLIAKPGTALHAVLETELQALDYLGPGVRLVHV
jgi:hypothetical protein